jgi:hypothetical protein
MVTGKRRLMKWGLLKMRLKAAVACVGWEAATLATTTGADSGGGSVQMARKM